MSEKNKNGSSCRLGTVGGQAVLEGVMMKSAARYSVAVRKDDGTITVSNHHFQSVRDKNKIFNLPLIRGVVNLVEMLILSYKTLTISAEAMGIEDVEAETKFEKWLMRHFGKNIMNIVMGISTVFAVALCLLLFLYIPAVSTKGLDILAGGHLGWFKNLIEGIIKIAVFVAYLSLVSLMPDIKRTFEYHGAEHKSIFCYENGEELTPENVKKYKRFHPRCGTSFLFVMMIIGIMVSSLPFVTWDNMILRILTKFLLLFPIIALGYEFIRYAGRHDNILVRILSAPGLWIQRITTREPDESQIEVAIAALKSSLPDEFPGYTVENISADASVGDTAVSEGDASDGADVTESDSAACDSGAENDNNAKTDGDDKTDEADRADTDAAVAGTASDISSEE